MSSLADFDVEATATSSGGCASQAQSVRLQSEQQRVGRTRLMQRIHRLGGTAVEVADDGNCMFEALSFQLFRTRRFHRLLRMSIVSAIAGDQRKRFEEIIGDDVSDYVRDMAKDRTWGDEYALLAAAALVPATVMLITSLQGKWRHTFPPPSGRAPRTSALLAYVTGVHYFSVVFPPEDGHELFVDLRGLVSTARNLLAARRGVERAALSRFALARRQSLHRRQVDLHPVSSTLAAVTIQDVLSGRFVAVAGDAAVLASSADVWYLRTGGEPNRSVLQHALDGRFLAVSGDKHVILSHREADSVPVRYDVAAKQLMLALDHAWRPLADAGSSLMLSDTECGGCRFDTRVVFTGKLLCTKCLDWYDPAKPLVGVCDHSPRVC